MDITSIAAAMSSLKAVTDLTQSMVGLANAQTIQSKVFELQRKILDTQQAMFSAHEERATLVARVGDLEKDLAAARAWDRERERYTLSELVPGIYAYSLKPDKAAGEPLHHLCAGCDHAGKKSILQGSRRVHFQGMEVLHCHGCGAELRYHRNDLPPQPPPMRRRMSSF